MHVIWSLCGICGMVQPLPALPWGAVVSWLCSEVVLRTASLDFLVCFNVYICELQPHPPLPFLNKTKANLV